jgi:hypothetical protein
MNGSYKNKYFVDRYYGGELPNDRFVTYSLTEAYEKSRCAEHFVIESDNLKEAISILDELTSDKNKEIVNVIGYNVWLKKVMKLLKNIYLE